jgi:hypothetical protein
MVRLLAIIVLLTFALPALGQTPPTEEAPPKEKATEEAPAKDDPAKETTEDDPAKETADDDPAKETAEDAPAEETDDDAPAKEDAPAEGEAKAESETAPESTGILITDLKNVVGSGFDASANITLNSPEGTTDTIDGSYRYVWRAVAPEVTRSVDAEISLNGTNTPSEDDSGNDTGQSTMTLTVDGGAGPSSDHASFAYDKYINPMLDRPTFIFIEPQVRYESTAAETAGEDTDAPDVFSAAATAGIGFGRVYPSASYERASSILKILRRGGALTRSETPEELQELMRILKKRWEPTKDVLKAVDYLKEKGLLAAGETPSSMIAELVAIVEQSFDYKETGSEYRFGVNYNFITGDTQSDSQPLLIAASYTQVFGDERLVIQPFAYFYKRIDEDVDAFYGASLDIRYAKTARSELFFTDRFTPGSQNSIEAGWRYTLASFMNAEVKYTLDMPLGDAPEDPITGETEEQDWPATIIVSLKAGGRGL